MEAERREIKDLRDRVSKLSAEVARLSYDIDEHFAQPHAPSHLRIVRRQEEEEAS